jgi:hypothetical protein
MAGQFKHSMGKEVDEFVKAFLAAQKSVQDSALNDVKLQYYKALTAAALGKSQSGAGMDPNEFTKTYVQPAMEYLKRSGHPTQPATSAPATPSTTADGDGSTPRTPSEPKADPKANSVEPKTSEQPQGGATPPEPKPTTENAVPDGGDLTSGGNKTAMAIPDETSPQMGGSIGNSQEQAPPVQTSSLTDDTNPFSFGAIPLA